jgi:hypothetical protein
MNGRGVMKQPNGDLYEGPFIDGKRNGKGFETFGPTAKYDGFYKNDLRHGKGINVGTDGSRYEGDWVNGKPNGVGKTVMPDGSSYEGEYVEGIHLVMPHQVSNPGGKHLGFTAACPGHNHQRPILVYHCLALMLIQSC